MDLIDIYKTFYPTTAEYTFFSNAHITFSKIHHRLGHKTSPNKFKKIETMSSILTDYNGKKLGINYKKKTENFTNMWSLDNMLLNNRCVKEEIKRDKLLARLKKKKRGLK